MSRKELYKLYWIEKKSIQEIANQLEKNYKTIFRWMKKYNIPKRTHSEAASISWLRKRGGLLPTYKNLFNLYWKKEKSMIEIGTLFHVSSTTIKRWLKGFNIPVKSISVAKSKLKVSKEKLHHLHWDKKLSVKQIARQFGVTTTTISNYFKKLNIPRRKVTEILYELSLKKNPREPFSGDETEKAYLLALRSGDISSRQEHRSVRVSAGTTHPAMIRLFFKVFGKYGRCIKCPVKTRGYEWFLRSTLHESFNFLVKKSQIVPENEKLFYAFLAGFSDCEGSWIVSHSHNKYIQTLFVVRNTDYKLLKQVERRLEEIGYHPELVVETKKDSRVGAWQLRATKDCFKLTVHRRDEVALLAKKLLPYSRHKEKITKMKLLLQIANETQWPEVKNKVMAIRRKIKKEVKNCIEEAKQEWHFRHLSI